MGVKKDNITYEDAVAKWAKGKFVTVDNKKIHYLEQGEGKPVILIQVKWLGPLQGGNISTGFKDTEDEMSMGDGFDDILKGPSPILHHPLWVTEGALALAFTEKAGPFGSAYL